MRGPPFLGATLLLSELKGERWFAVWVVGLSYSVVSVGNVRAPSRNESGAPSIRRRTLLL
jgi:hypothetical protein